jgi:hypothetical protein
MFELPLMKYSCDLVGLCKAWTRNMVVTFDVKQKTINAKNNGGLKFKHSSFVGDIFVKIYNLFIM